MTEMPFFLFYGNWDNVRLMWYIDDAANAESIHQNFNIYA